MESLFIHYLTLWRPLGYSIVFLGVMFEGDLFVLLTASLVRLGYFDPIDMFIVLYAGAVIGDMAWLYLGSKAEKTSNAMLSWIVRHTQRLPVSIEHRFFFKLTLSKFMYGTHRPFLFALGTKGVPLRKFIPYELAAVFIWLFTISGIGYGLGAALAKAEHALKYVEVGLVLVVVLYLVGAYVLKRYSASHHLLDES
jgi:membrane protein DedA with SNARE-associated domain